MRSVEWWRAPQYWRIRLWRTKWRELEPAASIIGVDGRELVGVPLSLMWGRVDGKNSTLARALVAARPDRFVLTGATRPDGAIDCCGLKGSADPIDEAAFYRRRRMRWILLRAIPLALFAIGCLYLVFRLH
jgi:hypothetical protein